MSRKKSTSKHKKKKNTEKKITAPELSPAKLRLFRILLLLIPLLLFAFLEIGLRLAGYGMDEALFRPSPADSRYLELKTDIGRRYFPSGQFYPNVSHNFMLAQKPANGFRIFVLGGSSARGYPYYYNGSFSTMLRIMLENSYPNTYFEVLNLSMVAVNSYTVRDLTMRLWKYQPDLILIYSGHNEFYGAMGVGSLEGFGQWRPLILLYLKLSRWKTFQLLQNIVNGIRSIFRTRITAGGAPAVTVMERMAAKKQIAYHNGLYYRAMEIFRENMRDVAQECRRRNTPLIWGTLVSNVRDQPPFIDAHLQTTDLKKWEHSLQQGKTAMAENDWQAAENNFRQCIQRDSLAATPVYLLGKVKIYTNDSVSAYRYLYRAKDLDALRFRASEDFNRILADLSRQYALPLAPVKQEFERHSPGRIPGKELLLEHLHPNLHGYFLMAKAFYHTIRDAGILPPPAHPLPPDSVLWEQLGLTPLDEEVGKIRIQVLTSGWPFRKGQVGSLADIDYQPQNRMQELAYQYWQGKITWEEAHVYLADYYLKRNQLTKAEQEFKALIVFTPFNPSPYQHLIRIYLQQKKWDRALFYLHRLKRFSDDLFTNRTLGKLYFRKNLPEKAIPYLERAYRLASTDPQTLYLLGVSYLQLGRVQPAEELLRKLQQLSPDFPGLNRALLQLKTK